MPHIPGREEYHGYISPAPPKGAPKEVRDFMARTYGGLRESKYPGEIPANKERASRITWYQTKRKFGKKYPELFRKNKGHASRDPAPSDLTGKEKQIERGARMEYREHPEFGKKAARQIAIDHIRKDPNEYLTGNKYLKPVAVRPAPTTAGRKSQARQLRAAAQQQRRWAKTAGNEQRAEHTREVRFRKAGQPVIATDIGTDAKVAGRFAKERRNLADNYDLQAARIEAISQR